MNIVGLHNNMQCYN